MMCSQFFWLIVTIIATTLSSSSAFIAKTRIRIKLHHNCDYVGNDIGFEAGRSNVCGGLCAKFSKCTNWTWTNYNGGTCWLKSGKKLFTSIHQGYKCGYIINRISTFILPKDAVHLNRTEIHADPIHTKPHAAPNVLTSPTQTDLLTTYNNGLKNTETAEMLASINSHRNANGLTSLTVDARLMDAAMVHSTDQATRCIMEHNGGNGSNPWDRMESQGYHWLTAAENVCAGQRSVSEAMISWWHSEGHRANILKKDVKNVGFAVAYNNACSDYNSFWTQDFGAE